VSSYIFACRVYLDSDPTVANASDIGLYDDADNGSNQVFRFIGDDISSYSPTYTWKPNILIPGAFSVISEGVETIDGGNTPSISGANVSIVNTLTYGGVFTQLDKILDDNNLRLNGLRCDIIEFEIVAGALVEVDGVVRFRGSISNIVSNEMSISISVEPSFHKRRANLATVINSEDYSDASEKTIGKPVPITLGEFSPIYDTNGNLLWNGYAKFIKTADSENEYVNQQNFVFETDASLNITRAAVSSNNVNLNIFPIVGDDNDTPPIAYAMKIVDDESNISWFYNDVIVNTGQYSLEYFNDKFITVVEGTGSDLSRKIKSALVDLDLDQSIIQLTLYDYFEETLSGNATATETNQTWVKIKNVVSRYSADFKKCKSFLDYNGNEINQGLDIFTYDSEIVTNVSGESETVSSNIIPENFILLPKYAYESYNSTYNNTVEIDVKQFTNDINILNNFYLFPIDDITNISSSDLTELGLTGYSKVADGTFKKDGAGTSKFTLNSEVVSGTFSNVTDKNFASLYQKAGNYTVRNYFWRHAYNIKLPDLPDNLPDNFQAFLLCKFATCWGGLGLIVGEDSQITFYVKRFIGNIFSSMGKTGWSDDINSSTPLSSIRQFETTPDFYFETNKPSRKNEWFYWNNSTSTTTFSGYMNIELEGVKTKDIYNSIKNNCAFTIRRETGNIELTINDYIRIYEMAIAIKRQINIKEEIFLPFKGRIYDDTWGSRKTAANMINNPIDILEHVKRLGNWSEVGETKNWGKEYATAPLIDTATTEGGFDYADLSDIKAIRPARQILNYNKAWSDDITKSICNSFFLVSFQDPTTGNEQVSYIAEKSTTTPSTTITLSDILGEIGEVKYPEIRGIYCEPVIRYAKNNANGEYERVIQITNSNAAAFDSSYVIGLSGSDAELMWARANTLWKTYRQIEKPPDSLTTNDWIVNDTDAVWYLDTWFSWMGAINTDGSPSGVTFEPKKRISFTVPYEIGKDWFLTQHHLLQLPHQTDDSAIEFMIERISKNISKGSESVNVQAVLYGASTEISLYIQDTYVNGTTLVDWQDDYDTQAVDPTNANDVQDIT